MPLSPTLLSFLLMQAEAAPAPVVEPTATPVVTPAVEHRQAFPVSLGASLAGGLLRSGDSYHGREVAAQLSVDGFVRRPVVDDGTPLGLQPYLQRLDRVSLGVASSVFNAKDDASLYEQNDTSVALQLSALFHRRWSVFGGQLNYAYLDDRQRPPASSGAVGEARQQLQCMRPSVTFGVRDRRLELRAGYNINACVEGGAFRRPSWGQAVLSGTLVLEDFTYFVLDAFTLSDGGGFSAKYELFPSSRLGVWLGGGYDEEQRESLLSTGTIAVVGYSNIHGELGVEWWRSNRFALLAWLSGNVYRDILKDRSAYGSESGVYRLLVNLGIVARAGRREVNTEVPSPAR